MALGDEPADQRVTVGFAHLGRKDSGLRSSWALGVDQLHKHHPPLNLLDIQEFRPRSPPSGFTRYFNFLDRAISFSALASKPAVDPDSATVGKDSLRAAANDISMCRRFAILAQGGMFSGFHVDHFGVWAGCTFEPTMADASHEHPASLPGKPLNNASPLRT